MMYIQCPYCGTMLSVPEEYKNDKRLQCSQCRHSFDNVNKREKKHFDSKSMDSTEQNKELSTKGKIVTGFLFLVICCIFYYCNDPTGVNSSGSVGDRIIITTNTWGTLDDESSSLLYQAMSADDAYGRYELVQSGKARFISQGTRGRINRRGVFSNQIRFDDGSLFWVPREHIKKE